MSQLNASEQLCLITLFQGETSCHLELGGPSEVALDVVPTRGMLAMGSAKESCLLDLGDCSGAGTGGAAEADSCSTGEVPCDKVNRWDVGVCPNKI